MDRVPGRADFATATDDERRAVVDDYVDVLARLHQLDLGPFVDGGHHPRCEPRGVGARSAWPATSTSTGARSATPSPSPSSPWAGSAATPPVSRGREAPVVWDSGQFHHAGGRVVAVLDLELGHLGDPMMDLAGWRMRDTIVGYGDFAELYDRYAELTGTDVDLDAVRIHHFAFTLTNQLAFGAALRATRSPSPTS